MKKQRKIFVTGIMVAAILFGSIGINVYRVIIHCIKMCKYT